VGGCISGTNFADERSAASSRVISRGMYRSIDTTGWFSVPVNVARDEWPNT